MMDVMSSVQLGSAMGNSDDPDPRMQFPKFPQADLDEFKAGKGKPFLEITKVLSGPLGFYLFTRWGTQHPKAYVRNAFYFLKDNVRLHEYLGTKFKRQRDAMKKNYLPFEAPKFKKNDKYTGKFMLRKDRKVSPKIAEEGLYDKHVRVDDEAAFPIQDVGSIVDTDNDDLGVGFDVIDDLCIMFIEKTALEEWISTESFAEYLRFIKIQVDVPPCEDWFQAFRTMGRGGFGLVRGCRTLTTGHLYAMKEMEMKRVKLKHGWSLCKNEHWVLTAVNSPFTVKLAYAYKTETHLKLIMDLMMGGDLSYQIYTYRVNNDKKPMPEDFAMYYMARTILGIEVLHDHGILYRDLKPENVLIHDDGRSKLSDMGLATNYRPGLKGMCGTMGFAAPEMFKKGVEYGYATDWWSLGCMIFCMVDERSPFRTKDAMEFGGATDPQEGMKNATVSMDIAYPANMSPDLRDLAVKLLDRNPATRLGSHGAHEICAHPFFRTLNWDKMRADEFTPGTPRELEAPPIVPGRSLNIQDQDKIGMFDKLKEKVDIEKGDFPESEWLYTSPLEFQGEVVWLLSFLATPKGRAKAEENYKVEAQSDGKSSFCTIL